MSGQKDAKKSEVLVYNPKRYGPQRIVIGFLFAAFILAAGAVVMYCGPTRSGNSKSKLPTIPLNMKPNLWCMKSTGTIRVTATGVLR